MKKILTFVLLMVFAITAAAVHADMDYSAQIDLIAANSDLWKQDVEYFQWGYTVTDLDHNDRLEIISCSVQGTGFYSYIKAYEVNEAGTGLTDIMEKMGIRTDSAPDIMVSRIPVYFDKEANRYYYIFDDMIRNGMAEYYENKRAVSLSDSVWEETMLANKTTIYTDPEHSTVTCQDADGNTISQAQLETIAETVYAHREAGEVWFKWFSTTVEDFAAVTAPQLIENLKSAIESSCPVDAQ